MWVRAGLVAALLSLALPVSAQWNAGGEEVPDTEWRKSVGEFGAMLLVTNDPDGFFEAWGRPSSADYKPVVETAEEARRGETVVGLVVFIGCSADDRGNCRADMDLQLLYPDGSLYGEFKEVELWQDKPAPAPGYLQVSVGNLGLLVEPDDPFGTYEFKALVRDRIAGKELKLTQTIEVVPETK